MLLCIHVGYLVYHIFSGSLELTSCSGSVYLNVYIKRNTPQAAIAESIFVDP